MRSSLCETPFNIPNTFTVIVFQDKWIGVSEQRKYCRSAGFEVLKWRGWASLWNYLWEKQVVIFYKLRKRDPFTISEPQNQSIGNFFVDRKRYSNGFQALNWWKSWSVWTKSRRYMSERVAFMLALVSFNFLGSIYQFQCPTVYSWVQTYRPFHNIKAIWIWSPILSRKNHAWDIHNFFSLLALFQIIKKLYLFQIYKFRAFWK